MMIVKKKILHNHFKQRFLDRYGKALTKHDIDSILLCIKNGKFADKTKQSLTRQRYKIPLKILNGFKDNEETITVIYDKKHGRLVTVLPNKENNV